jgi:hypothetical protein
MSCEMKQTCWVRHKEELLLIGNDSRQIEREREREREEKESGEAVWGTTIGGGG